MKTILFNLSLLFWLTTFLANGTAQDCRCVGSTRDLHSSVNNCPYEPPRTTQHWTVYCSEGARAITTWASGECKRRNGVFVCREPACLPEMGVPVVSGAGWGCEWKQVNSNMRHNYFCKTGCSVSSVNIFLVGCNSCPVSCDPTGFLEFFCQSFEDGIWNDLTCDCETGPYASPILFSPSDNHFELTDVEEGVPFDLNADGKVEQTAWVATGSDELFLALDRNSNGRIDDGSELFGDAAPQPEGHPLNGFRALAILDLASEGGNEDGWIDHRDLRFKDLLVWSDSKRDGISQTNELSTADAAGIEKISLDYQPSHRRDRFGNLLRFSSQIYLRLQRGSQPAARRAIDVYLLTRP